MAFAASPSGDAIVAVNYWRLRPDPDLCRRCRPLPEPGALRRELPVPCPGRRQHVLQHVRLLAPDIPQGGPWLEVLQQQLLPGGGGRWAWSALPDPPDLARGQRESVLAYFVAGARIWISLHLQGTYSFDTARQRWRKEGAWVLPVLGRVVLVPDFLGSGRRLLSASATMITCLRRRHGRQAAGGPGVLA
ncbi:hypothetical protein ZWY2020_011395 [Hordeum vulgare]|nr:hypothetical protein ZWY2020_011395 [Hordeum vulgare]